MFILQLDENKNLTLTKTSVNYRFENNAESILILMPQVYNGYNLRDCDIRLDRINPDGAGSGDDIKPDDELHDSFLKCTVSITKEWTYKDGIITLWLTIIHSPNEGNIGTNEVYMPVKNRKVIEDYIPTHTHGTLDQLVIDIANKADGLLYENDMLQLTSEGNPIGDPVMVTGGTGTSINGKSIEYIWDDTSLGIRQEGEDTYDYVDLKGEKGLKGDKGDKGLKGDNGQTPVKGTDYFTSADIEAIKAAIKADIETDLTSIPTISAVSDVYTIDFQNKPSINRLIITSDTVDKTIAVANVPTRTEMYLELEYAHASDIAWFDNISWKEGHAPTLITDKLYRIVFFTSNGGEEWHGCNFGGM